MAGSAAPSLPAPPSPEPTPLRCCENDVKIARHQQLRAPWLTPYCLADLLHRRSVFGGKVHSHYVPPPRPRRDLEPNEVGSKLLHRLHHKVWRRAVEDCDTAAVSAWRVRRDDAIAGRPAGVDNISEFSLLEDSHIHVSLGHPPQCCIETSLPSVANVVDAKSNRHLPTRRTPGTVAHAPLTVPRFPCPPPAHACLAGLPCTHACCPCWPDRSVPVSVLVPFFPVLSPPCRSPRQSPVVPYNLGQVAVFLKVTVVASYGTIQMNLFRRKGNPLLVPPPTEPQGYW